MERRDPHAHSAEEATSEDGGEHVQPPPDDEELDDVDKALADSFPASDPPAMP